MGDASDTRTNRSSATMLFQSNTIRSTPQRLSHAPLSSYAPSIVVGTDSVNREISAPIEKTESQTARRFYIHWWQELTSTSFGMYLDGRSLPSCNLLTAIYECRHYLYDAYDLDIDCHAR